MYKDIFLNQTVLLLQCLPSIRLNKIFALKGGTAINFFINNLPRLSVDIDLSYIPIEPRDISINKMQQELQNIKNSILKNNPSFVIKEQLDKTQTVTLKLLVSNGITSIKIEPNFIVRGALLPLQYGTVCDLISEKFKISTNKITMLSTEEIYAGKICAALNRQHPRDLFDIKLLFENGGITETMRQAFVIYLASNPRPMHELLNPNLLDLEGIFETDFNGMISNDESISYADLLGIRKKLIMTIQNSLTQDERKFLLSMKLGEPQWNLMPFKNINKLPALQWKLINIKKMDKKKHMTTTENLKRVLCL